MNTLTPSNRLTPPPAENRLAPVRQIVWAAWIIMLLVSMLPNIIFTELFKQATPWLFWAKLGLLAVLIGVSYFWHVLTPLRKYLWVLAAIFGVEYLVATGTQLLVPWQRLFGGLGASFSAQMLGTQLQRFIVSLLIIGVMFLLGYRAPQFFLTRGDLRAPTRPIPWLGIKKSESWLRFGRNLAFFISLGTLLFLVIGGRPSLASLGRALPLLPLVLLFASLNAFNEELTYRASLLAPLENAVGYKHALGITAAFFGLGHFYGVPYGLVGVAMATFLGWLLGKAMLETRGFCWSWFIHFLQDVLIFSFMAIGSIVPGG